MVIALEQSKPLSEGLRKSYCRPAFQSRELKELVGQNGTLVIDNAILGTRRK